MTRLLAGRALRILIGLLALIEAIFLAEAFTTLMENVVQNGGSAPDLARLLLLESPKIVDFALPIVLLVGLYFAITAARDHNELVVCAAAGVPWTRIPGVALVAGLLALVLSLVFAGVLTPLASYGQRLAMHELRAGAVIRRITEPDTVGRVQHLQGRTVVSSAPEQPDAQRGNIFIYHPDEGAGWRVSQAEDWAVIGPTAENDYAVKLRAFRDYTGNLAPTQLTDAQGTEDALRATLQIATITVKNLSMDFRLEQVIRGIDRIRRKHELTLFELLSRGAAEGEWQVNRDTGEMLGRAIICLFAALSAVAAAAWSASRVGRIAALPVAAVAVLLGDVVARALLGDAAHAGAGALLGGSLVLLVAAIALPLALVLKRGELILAPGRGE